MEASGRITGDGEAPLIVQYRRGICRKASRQIRGILSGREVPFPEQVHIPGSRRQRTASLSQLKPYHDEGTDAKSTNAEGLDTEGVNDTSSNGVPAEHQRTEAGQSSRPLSSRSCCTLLRCGPRPRLLAATCEGSTRCTACVPSEYRVPSGRSRTTQRSSLQAKFPYVNWCGRPRRYARPTEPRPR